MGVASHPSLFLDLFFIFNYFVFFIIFKSKIIKYCYFFNSPCGMLMALGSLRRDPSHQLDALQSILDWRGFGSSIAYCFAFLLIGLNVSWIFFVIRGYIR
jgi:hypothetical protein